MSDILHTALERMGARDLRSTPEGFESQCPMCDSRRRSFRAAYIGKNGRPGAFWCHKCGVTGGLCEILMRAYGMTRARAEEMSGDMAVALRKRRKKHTEEEPLDMSMIAPYRAVLSQWLVDRGYTEEWIWHYRVGMDLMSEEVVYPTYNLASDLMGITRRVAEDGRPAYHLGDFQKSKYLWGLDLAVKTGSDRVYVVEGQTGTLGLAPVVEYPVVASFGSEMSETQAKKLVSNFKSVVLVYDDDWAGHRGVDKARSALRKYGVKELLFGFVPDDIDDTGELPHSEYPEIETMNFLQWKKRTGFKTNVKRIKRSTQSTEHIKITAKSQKFRQRS